MTLRMKERETQQSPDEMDKRAWQRQIPGEKNVTQLEIKSCKHT